MTPFTMTPVSCPLHASGATKDAHKPHAHCHLANLAAKLRYQRVTHGTVQVIPLSTVRSGFMANAIHCRQATSLTDVVLHVPLGNFVALPIYVGVVGHARRRR